MTLLESIVERPWAAAVGWTLLHSLWEGAIMSAVLAAVLVAAKSPRIRYAAACLAMLAILGVFGATLFHMAPHAAHVPNVVKTLPFPVWNTAVMTSPNAWDPNLTAIAPWLAPFWIAGVFVFYLRYAAGFLSVSRLRRRGVCAVPECWQQKLQTLGAQLRVSRPVLLLESSLAEAPMVIGHVRPLILMPVGLITGLPATQIETILLHELAHIRRHDFLINALQNLVDGLLFYHPAVWWISHVIRAEREKCCDDVVVGTSGNAHEYARALAALEETRWSGREPAVAAKGGSLMKRIRRLLYPTGPNVAWTPVLATAVLLITAAVTLGAWQQNEPLRSHVLKACPESARSSGADVTDYNKWLDEDVVYIIDDAERAAFQKLTTDEERACFVDQFWERRNPTPGASENAFKTEHYRRIEVANKRFPNASGAPGWQTDRGHMYILYGPPDEIDSHPSAKPQPYEMWGYRSVDGQSEMSFFRFVDKSGRGDYRLAPSTGH
jgi:GWxTD domain-containing protein